MMETFYFHCYLYYEALGLVAHSQAWQVGARGAVQDPQTGVGQSMAAGSTRSCLTPPLKPPLASGVPRSWGTEGAPTGKQLSPEGYNRFDRVNRNVVTLPNVINKYKKKILSSVCTKCEEPG
jgi:hypothetical protein